MKIDEIINLRHDLHKHAEISNNEFKTSDIISKFVNKLRPDYELNLSKTGKAFVFDSGEEGKTIMFRADMDALPIEENTLTEYSSLSPNIAHSCGHDGHMAIVAGLAQRIAENRPQKGKVVLLFQPAEEVEQGAKAIIEDKSFKKIEPDYIFGLHNIPAAEKNVIYLKSNSFAAASKGMTVKLLGKTSHAAEPENGISPAGAISQIITNLHSLRESKSLFKDLILLTFIHIKMGEISFGTSPGYAEISITLRAFENEDMEILTNKVENIIRNIAEKERLIFNFKYKEVFPATVNNDECLDIIRKSAIDSNLRTEKLIQPFKWSEDFAYYAQKYKAGFFGLGAGRSQPQLHNPEYDFPDDILESGISVFYNIYKRLNF